MQEEEKKTHISLVRFYLYISCACQHQTFNVSILQRPRRREEERWLTLSSNNQTVIRFSKQLAAQLSWHQTLTLQ